MGVMWQKENIGLCRPERHSSLSKECLESRSHLKHCPTAQVRVGNVGSHDPTGQSNHYPHLFSSLRDRATVARLAHTQEVVGSNPSPATSFRELKITGKLMDDLKIKIPRFDMKVPKVYNSALAERIKTDFWYLTKEVLGYGYNELTRKGFTGNDPVHIKLFDALFSPERFKLLQLFRGSYKTTAMISFIVQEFCKNPNVTILYVSQAAKHSQKVLRAVKSHLTQNKTLIELFGRFKPTIAERQEFGLTWNQFAIDLALRPRPLSPPWNSLQITGIGGEVTGTHPDIIIFDDVVVPKNITTYDQKTHVIEYFNQSIPLLGSSGRLIVVGTPWDFDDAYAYIINEWVGKKDSDGSPLFRFIRMGIEDPQTGEPTMPSVYGHPEIEQIRAVTTSIDFAKQYMCNPFDESTVAFRKQDIVTYTSLPDVIFFREHESYSTVDPAISLDRKKCWTGICNAVPANKYYLYVQEADRYKLLPDEMIEMLVDMVNKYSKTKTPIRKIGIEDAAFQKIYKGSLINELRNNMLKYPNMRRTIVVPLVPNDSKDWRIWALQPYIKDHQVIFNSVGVTKAAFDQIFAFPHLSDHNKDILDSLAFMLQILPSSALINPYGIIKKAGDEGREMADASNLRNIEAIRKSLSTDPGLGVSEPQENSW